MNLSIRIDQNDFFASVFQDKTLNIVMVSLGSFCWIVNLIGSFCNFWYLRYATGRRTLVGRSVESISKLTISYLLLVQTVDFLRYIYGPLGETFCIVHVAFKNALNVIFALTITSLSLFKHIYSNWKEDFTDVQEEFLGFFTNLWAFLFANISQAVFVFAPGRQPVSYYVCAGSKPSPEVDVAKTKMNYVVAIVDVIGVVTFFWVTAKSILLKKKLDKSIFNGTKKFDLKSYRGDILGFISGINLMFWYNHIITKVNSLKLSQVNTYPYYYYIHALFIIFPTLTTFSLTSIYFFQNKRIYEFVAEELQFFFDRYIKVIT